MDSLENDDQLTIVNRSTEHRISKKLIRKIPYFEKMLSHNLKESKENKVELDFDEQTFQIIFDWAASNYNFIMIEMDYIMGLCELADYFGLDWISKQCITYFDDNFSIEHLPFVIPKINVTSKCINSGALNAFICRYFLKLANTIFWFEYPIETIEYICALDLMIYSEYQVFEVIMRWINIKADSRKCHLEGLLKLVRWCHLNEEDLSKIKENELLKSSGLEPIFCAPRKVNCDCIFNRTKQNFFIMIEELDSRGLQINVLDNNFKQLVSQVIQEDASISSNLFHDEHISDITYNSGMTAIRIDWKQNKYKYIAPFVSYIQVKKWLTKLQQGDPFTANHGLPGEIRNGFLLLEAAKHFIPIYIENSCLRLLSGTIYENYKDFHQISQYKATLVDNRIYLLSDGNLCEYVFAQSTFFRLDNVKLNWSHRIQEFRFEYSLLTSSPAGDKIILIDKYTKNYICIDLNTKRKSKGRMISYCYADGQKESKTLLTLTSAFLPLTTIRTCLNSKSNSDK
ncbi:uncharacterized protein LOC107370979 [Tetranychus urticae]|uniref:Uncharacterized protein n=1 Tax=Tetranychus urticae TaxID=32264 RepID=T1JXM8_TETUR|nr:uncharacterized protein LOC107370979 [Tetranychus urticae]